MSTGAEMNRAKNITRAVTETPDLPDFDPAWLSRSPSRKADPEVFESGSRTGLRMSGIAAVLIAAVGAGVFLYSNRKPDVVPSRALVISVRGQVEIQRGNAAPQAAHAGDILGEADRIATGPDSVLDLAVSGHALRILAESSATVSELRRHPDGSARSVRMSLEKGGILARAGRLAGADRFEVQTPTAIAGVRGTKFLVRSDASGTHVRLFEGSVAVQSNKGQDRIVEPGQTVRITQEAIEPGEDTASYTADFEELEANPDLNSEILQAAEALQTARTAEEIKELYSKIEIIKMRDGREFRGAVASQNGSRMLIHTPQGIYIVDTGEVEDVLIVEEQQ